jgi:hypothetical protein
MRFPYAFGRAPPVTGRRPGGTFCFPCDSDAIPMRFPYAFGRAPPVTGLDIWFHNRVSHAFPMRFRCDFVPVRPVARGRTRSLNYQNAGYH